MRLSRSRLRRMILQEIKTLNERLDTSAVEAELNNITDHVDNPNDTWPKISKRLLSQYGTRDTEGNVLTLVYGNRDFSSKVGL